MVYWLAYSPQSGQTKDYWICYFSVSIIKQDFGIRITCLVDETCLLADCCFSKQALEKSNYACTSSTM